MTLLKGILHLHTIDLKQEKLTVVLIITILKFYDLIQIAVK